MKKSFKYLLVAVMASLLALTACGANNNTNTPALEQEPTNKTEYETNGQESEPYHHYSDDTNAGKNTDSDIISLRLYYHSTEIDPNIYALPESFLYDTISIPAQNLRDEFIQLMYEHIGIQILDLWFVEDKLIVNLHRDSILFFDSHGTAGASIVITIFERTLASMPNITAFEVLLDGGRGFAGHHFDFNHIAIVENGEIVRRDFFGENFGMADFEIHVDLISNVNLGFNVLHEVNYNDVFEEIRGFRFDGEGVNLIIWANQPIFNLSMIALDHSIVDFHVAEALFTVDKLDSAAAEAFVINSYYGMGTMPWSGISFEGTFEGMTGVRRYFMLQQSGYDGRFFLNEFVPANTIEMPIAVTNEDYTQRQHNLTPAPHPFAIALREYMADYDGVVRAYLVTLDDDGAMGVLTTRPTTRVLFDYDSREYRYGASKTLFYMQDGDLFHIDVSHVVSNWLFVAGRYNRLMERLYAHTHLVEIIYKLESGRLHTSTRLEYFSDEYLSYLLDDHDAVAESIARRDALAEFARIKYGLVALPPPRFGHMRNTQDQTAQILAMTIDCEYDMLLSY